MIVEKLQIGGSCHLIHTVYGEGIEDLCIEYTEHSSDHWHSNHETSVDIDHKLAGEIIAFLAKHSKGIK